LTVCHDGLHKVRNLLTAKRIDWIPSYLSPETKAALREEMEKNPSAKDVPGHIYCYEIRDPKARNQVHLKVGHTAKLAKRLDEWGKQCGKEVVPRGLWPKTVDGAGYGFMRRQIQAGEKCKYSHRLEREQSKSALPNSLTPSYLLCRLDSSRALGSSDS
jgi:hypothetical protein